MKITAVRVQNYKRVRDIEIIPPSDRTLILIGGKNAQGKSSVLDALTAAFGGKRAIAADPVRHGAEEAEIEVVLDDGKLSIKRTISPGGDSTLELRDSGGKLSSPQARLDHLVASRFLDPIAFLQLSATEQRAQLLAMFDRDGAIAKLEERRERIYAKRTEVGRDLKKAAGELARLPPEVEVGKPIDVAALSAERAAIADMQRAGDGLGLAHREAKGKLEHAVAELGKTQTLIGELEKQLAAAMDARDEWAKQVEEREAAEADAKVKLEAARKEWADLTPRREQLDADLKRASEHNRAVFEAESNNKRRAAAAATVEQIEAQVEQQTELLSKIEQQKLKLLADVGLPVEGLGISKDGITLHDVPFLQASAAERLRVSLALAMAASPELRDVWVRDGALLDEDSLELMAGLAKDAGIRLWIERVGTGDAGAIVIHDGEVASDVAAA